MKTSVQNGTEAEFNAAMLLNSLCEQVHEANIKWWVDLKEPIPGQHILYEIQFEGRYYPKLDRNVGEMLCLVHSEISEALEGHRKNLRDDKLPHRPMLEVELADAIIRIFDIAAGLGLDLGGAFVEKMNYNRIREDHKIENRLKEGGKKY